MNRAKSLSLENERADSLRRVVETCTNPWNGHCMNSDIAVYIYYRGRKLPICRECWIEIAQKNIEWRYE